MTPSLVGPLLAVLKITVLVGLGLYVLFAGIIVRQEQLMTGVLEEGFKPVLRLVVILHLLLSIGLFGLAFILL